MGKTADVIVIGGGIMGTATAYHLTKRGFQVTLLEKEHLGAGSTGLTGGIIRQHYSIETTARMALRALKVWEHFDEVIGGDAGFTKTGAFFVASPEAAESLARTVEMQKQMGINAELLSKDAVLEIAPYLAAQDIGAAAYEPDSGFADGSMSCSAFAARAADLGGTIRQGIRVTGIRISNGRVTGVETIDGPIDAPVVINTAGPWGPALLREVGIEIPAEPSRHQVATFNQPHGFPDPLHPVVADFINEIYLRSDRGNLTLAGSIVDDTSDKVPDPDVYSTSVDRPFIEQMVDLSMNRVPDLGNGSVQGGWAGLYTVTPDWNPVIDVVEGIEGLVIGLGFSGSGFKLGPVVGEMLADLATGDQHCPISPDAFNLKRFVEGKDLSGSYEYSIIG